MFKSLLCSVGVLCTCLGSINPLLSTTEDVGYVVSCDDTSGNDVSADSSDDDEVVDSSSSVDLSTIENYLSAIADNTDDIASSVLAQVDDYIMFTYYCAYNSSFKQYITWFSYFLFDISGNYKGGRGVTLDSNNLPSTFTWTDSVRIYTDYEITSGQDALSAFISSGLDVFVDASGDRVQFSADFTYCLNCGSSNYYGYAPQSTINSSYNPRVKTSDGDTMNFTPTGFNTFVGELYCNNSVIFKGLIKLYWSYKDNLSPLYSYSQYSLPQWQEMYREYIRTASAVDSDGVYSAELNYENGVFLGITHLIYELSINRLILAYVSAILTVICVFIGVFVIRSFRKGTMFYGNNRK